MKRDIFIERAKKIHDNKYDYSLIPEEFKVHDKIQIICPKHGIFSQTAADHLSGRKCRKCKYDKLADEQRYTTESFIKRAKEIHGNKYDYSKANYIDSNTKVCIICHEKDHNGIEHGEFWQTPNAHLQKRGCPKCKQDKISHIGERNAEAFFKKCKEIHGNKYDYSKSVYINNITKMLISCPIHGEFWQMPKMHINGVGCPKCANIKRGEVMKSTTETFISKAKEIHGDKYDYSNTKYINSEIKVSIICHKLDPYGHEHGLFTQLPSGHLYGYGCPKCAKDILRLDTETFIEKARAIHGDKYDYSKVKYTHSTDEITIICPEHGEFQTTPNRHLMGSGCPKCSYSISKAEDEISQFIIKLVGKENVLLKDRNILSPKELDIYIPSKKIAIEYNGLYWHSEEYKTDKNYHLQKTEECRSKGLKLIQIFEDEYLEHKEIVLNKIKHILKCDINMLKIGARKTIVKNITPKEAESFLNENHIQGYSKSSIYLGAYFNNKIISIMSFVKNKENCFELNRFASDNKYICQGIGGKLFSYFIKKYNPLEVKSFADRRWTIDYENNLYTKLGFKLDKILPPDYRYVINGKRVHKFNCRKERLHKKYGLPLTMTEKEMTEKLGYYRIWDCGLIKYVWEKEE